MGYLELITGPMFSGKTSVLIEQYNEHITMYNKNDIIAINYDKDIRYGSNKIISHNGLSIDCISINELSELSENFTLNRKLESAKYIFINEAQFFKNLKSWVLFMIETHDKNIVLCGLDSDYKREKFGEILDLVPHADKITKLCGTCTKCSCKSIYTHRISDETEQEVIGVDNYIPVCRKCYNYLHFNSNSNISKMLSMN
jgi:thymidine kinase